MEDPDHLISVSEEPKKNSTLVITLVRLFASGHGSVARLILYKLKIRHGIWLVGAEPSDCGIIALRRLSGRGALRRLSGLHVSYDRDTMLYDIRHSIGHPFRPHTMQRPSWWCHSTAVRHLHCVENALSKPDRLTDWSDAELVLYLV